MKNGFYIMLNMRMTTGFENFGQFFLGNEQLFAKKLFAGLEGDTRISDKDVLHLDFTEFRNGLPVDLTIKSCTLGEIAQNCKIISKELFRINNLDKEDL